MASRKPEYDLTAPLLKCGDKNEEAHIGDAGFDVLPIVTIDPDRVLACSRNGRFPHPLLFCLAFAYSSTEFVDGRITPHIYYLYLTNSS